MKPLDFEKNIGIEAFLTKFKGIGGKLRTTVQDFIVNEIFLYPKKNETGSYTIAEVNSENWETHKLVRELSKRLKISPDKVYINISRYGNMSSASCAVAFCEAWEKNLIKKNDIIILDTFGGGLVWGSCAIRWL